MSFPESVLPLHMQNSRPDVVLIQRCSHAMNAISMHDRRSPSWVLHLVEVTVTSDFRVHDVVQSKTDQHETLLQNLRAYGWRDVRFHIFVVGHTGVMRALNAAMSQDLGVPNQLVTPLLKKVAVQTLYRSCGELNQYSGSRCAKQTAAGHLEPSLATDSPPDADGSGAAVRIQGKLGQPCNRINKVT